MATDGGFSDNEVLSATRRAAGPSSGWASLGAALGGGGEVVGQNAYDNGMRVGASTADALAQAADRVQKTKAAQQAASALDDPNLQTQLHLTPEQANWAKAQALGGAKAEDVTNALKGFQENNLRQTITQGGQAGRMAALALAPASGAPHAEGTNGTFIDPFSAGYSSDQAPSATNTPVSVGPQQTALNTAEVGQRNATAAKDQAEGSAATQNAATKASMAGANGGAGKPPPGMRWAIDPDTMEYKLDNTGRPTAEPIPGMDSKPEPSTSARFHSNTVLAGGNLANEVDNIKHLGVTTTLGATGTAGHTPGIMNTLKLNLGNKLSDSDQQNYNTSTNQLGRFIGIQENGGRAVPETLAQAITQNLANVPANTESARLVHLGAVKQAAQAADDTLQQTTASPQLKTLSAKNRARIEAAVPYDVGDAIDFGHSGKDGQTFQQFLDAKKGANGGSALPSGLKLVN